MNEKSLGLLAVLALVVAACGGSGDTVELAPDEAVIQITSEGGFAPVELVLGAGPRYTVLGDGTLIFSGVTTLEFPGGLIPPYVSAQLSNSQMNSLLAMVDDIGLPDIDDETDDSAANFVADATTEVIRYWDVTGEHRYAVYALGIEEEPSDRNAAFLELVQTLDAFTAQTPGEPYQPERARVIANVDAAPHEVNDLRPWPLGEVENFDEWTILPNGWGCQVFEGEVLSRFGDATQETEWQHPDQSQSLPPVKLLVRPLHPGEPDCP